MAVRKRKKRRKAIRYRTVKVKLSETQKRSLVNYCQARRTTPNKLIKKMIRPFLQKYAKDVPDEVYATENQLQLFE